MSLFLRIIQHLLPTGEAWRTTIDKALRRLFDGLSTIGAEARAYIDLVYLDLFPRTTRQLAEWEKFYGLAPSASTSEANRRLALAAEWQATGGQSAWYIQSVLQAAGFDVYVHPPWVPDRAPYDLAGAYYVKTFDYSAEATHGRGFCFGDHGRKLYVLDSGTSATHTVYQYDLGPEDPAAENPLAGAYDLARATYSGKTLVFSAQETNAQAIQFSADGTMLFIVGATAGAVFAYEMTVPWDVSTATYSGGSFSVAAQETASTGLFFKPDGLSFWIVGTAIYRYDLTTAWDIATASYASETLAVTGTVTGLAFSADGLRLFVSEANADVVRYWDLSTAWDVSTAALLGTFSIASQTGVVRDVFFGGNGGQAPGYDNGTRMFISSETEVFQFSVADYEPIDPSEWLTTALIGTTQCGEALAQCGEAGAVCGTTEVQAPDYIANRDLTVRGQPPLPTDPAKWPHFMYVGGPVFGDVALIDAARSREFERLILKLRPLHNWVGLFGNYVEFGPELVIDEEDELIFDEEDELLVG